MVRSAPSFRMRPYWLDRTEIWIPAFRRWAFAETLDACAEAVGLADVVSLAGAVELAGPADLDAAVLPHAASATAAPMGVIAGSRPTRPASRRGHVPTEADPPGPLVGLRGIVCSSRRRGFRRQAIVGGRRGVLPPARPRASPAA